MKDVLITGEWSTDGIVEVGAGMMNAEIESVTNRVTGGASGSVRLRIELNE